MRSKQILSWLGAGLVSLSAASADAAPKLRVQVDQRGDFALIGNTLAHDCASSIPSPVVGTVNNCGTNTSESGADVYWRSDEPSNGQARANNTITNADARSTAMLVLPAGATVTHAYLYWAAAVDSDTADTTAVIERPGTGGFSQNVTAIESYKAYATGTYPQRAYQSVANITSLVQQHGSGAYRVSGVDTAPLKDVNSETLFAGWWMAVFYSLPTDPPRNLALFDGLDPVSPNQTANATLSGFLVPNAGFTGKLGVVAFEGDNAHTGDQLFFNGGAALFNDLNPSDNFFNATRSDTLGNAITVVGDLPQLSGARGSMSGLDLDIVDVKAKLKAGDTSATVEAKTSLDVFFLGGFITSISTYRPDFTTSTKSAVDLNGGALLPGDTLEYTIVVTNTGNDASVNTVLSDPLPAGVTYVPGTLRVVSGPNAGAKTDATGDDQGNYNAATRTVTFRLGTGANATNGGTLAVNASTTVSFQVKVDANASGTISNQATITAAGQLGAPVASTPTDGNGPVAGNPPTESVIDQCANDTQCGGAKPYCKTDAHPYVCVECKQDSHCSGATATCDALSNTCICTPSHGGVEICDSKDNNCDGQVDEGCECLADGDCSVGEYCDVDPAGGSQCLDGCRGDGGNGCAPGKICTSTTAAIGQCVQCVTDSHCGGQNSGLVCNSSICVPGCRGTGGNQCQGVSVCTSTDATIGQCVACTNDGHCGNATSGKVCASLTHTCIDGCRGESFGNGCAGVSLCTSTDATIGACVGCLTDSDCGDATSATVCDESTKACVPGCRGSGGNGCSAAHVCTSADDSVGQCVGCFLDVHCGGPDSGKVCNTGAHTCVDGCRGEDGNGCADELVCTSTDDVIGECVTCLVDTDCGETTSGKVCDTDTNTCADGCRGEDGNGCSGSDVCTSTDDTVGQCVGCLVDSDCGDTTSGSVCDDATKACIAGCRGTNGNGCFGAEVVCTSTDDTIGQCVGCLDDGDCGVQTSGKVCDSDTQTCIDGCRDTGGNDCSGSELCTSTDDGIGTCVECLTDADCGNAESGKVCDTTNTCIEGCRGEDGNGCSDDEVCTSSDDTIGTCENPGAGGAGGEGGSAGAGGGDGTGGSTDKDGGVGGDDFGADDSDVWATGNGILCSAQPGSSTGAAGWLLGGALVAFAAARRRRG